MHVSWKYMCACLCAPREIAKHAHRSRPLSEDQSPYDEDEDDLSEITVGSEQPWHVQVAPTVRHIHIHVWIHTHARMLSFIFSCSHTHTYGRGPRFPCLGASPSRGYSRVPRRSSRTRCAVCGSAPPSECLCIAGAAGSTSMLRTGNQLCKGKDSRFGQQDWPIWQFASRTQHGRREIV